MYVETNLVDVARSFLNDLKALLDDVLVEVSVFGSTVKGTSHSGSDIDVLVIVKGDKNCVLNAVNKISSSLGDRWIELASQGHFIELTIMSLEEWRSMLEKGFSFPVNVERDKLVIYRS
ncbi:nucleotidyltransferase domain-containing protein [Candidatus Bathyarchaeota archaeon]|nr:nucleotidyltransferase domain-containing protein [Candidatus Brockarchaeota archaeon]MBS7614023.1 nucleotidyltransferase domain-containing protein [Candidatus Bathyarchaeota archaeon]